MQTSNISHMAAKHEYKNSQDLSLIISLYISTWLLLPPAILNNIIPYSTPGGFFFFKFHPATWIFFIWLCINRFSFIVIASHSKGINKFIIFFYILLSIYFILNDRFALLSTFIDILVIPSIIAEIISSRSAKIKISLLTDVALTIILITAVVLYIEVGTGIHMVEREGYDPYNRPGGWYGHPLAAATIFLVGIVLIECRSENSGHLNTLAIFFLFGAIVLSGTRGPLLVGGFCLVRILTKKIASGTLSQRFSTIIFCVLIMPFSLFHALENGIFDRFLALGFDDDSADARRNIWDVFHIITNNELFFGISSYDVIEDLALTTAGVPFVENAFIIVCLQSGIFAASIYFCIVIVLCFRASFCNLSYGFMVLGSFIGTITFATKGSSAPMIFLTGALVLAATQEKSIYKLTSTNTQNQ